MIDLLIGIGILALVLALCVALVIDLERVCQTMLQDPDVGPAQGRDLDTVTRHEAVTPKRGTGRASTPNEAA